jgi:hypothetical protein
VLILIQPRIKVKYVVNATASELEMRDVEFSQQGKTDPEITGGFLLGQATHKGQRQAGFVHD